MNVKISTKKGALHTSDCSVISLLESLSLCDIGLTNGGEENVSPYIISSVLSSRTLQDQGDIYTSMLLLYTHGVFVKVKQIL